MPKKAKGLTRSISRSHALSYNRTPDVEYAANGPGRSRLGVTHLAEINGPGAYERRYQATRQLLENNAEADSVAYTAKQRAAMKKMTPARRAAFKKMLDRSPSIDELQARRSGPKRSRKRKSASRKATPNQGAYHANKMKRSERPSKSKFLADQKRKGRSQKQAEAAWKLAHGRHMGAGKKKGRQGRVYGAGKTKSGKKVKGFSALRASIGPKSRWTYKYSRKTKSGKRQVRDIPDYALLGFKSRAEMREVGRDMGRSDLSPARARRARALEKRYKRLMDRRERDAEKARQRILAGKGTFTPNAEDLITYEEWEEMRPNRRSKTSTKKKKPTKKSFIAAQKRKGRSQKQAEAAWNLSHGRKSGGRKAGTKKKTTRRKTTATKKKTTRRKSRKLTAAQGKTLVAYVKNRPKRRRRRKTSMRKNQGAYAANRRRRSTRRYKRNQGYVAELSKALKLGAFVTAGFAAHRALTRVVDDMALSKIEAFQSGTLGTYRGLISGLITAAAGIGVTMMSPLRQSKAPIAAGMAASFIHGALVTALTAADQGKAASYLSNYPNAEGSMYGHAIGSYYTFKPHEVYSGYGSYYEIPQPQPMAGFGASPMVTQAAAGYGAAPMLTQAAAGYGAAPMLTQAAAGMGQAQLTQAAAGTGEYVAYGASAIGEYEEMPVSGVASHTDEGIHPNLHSAEQALSVAEAAAGVGSAEVPLQSTVNPTMIADPIADLPGGSRAGVFTGGDGIFG